MEELVFIKQTNNVQPINLIFGEEEPIIKKETLFFLSE